MPRVLLGVAGTGGHVYPAVALAEHLRGLDSNVEVRIAGKRGGQEETIAARYKLGFHAVRVVKTPAKKLSLDAFLFGGKALAVAASGISVVGKFRPDVVVGFGGYGSFPTVIGAVARRVPVFIHEQNSVTGKANETLARFARGVFVSYKETARNFGDKAIFTGNPSRYDGWDRIDAREAREKLGLDPERKTIFAFGGSQGAQSLNEAAIGFASINKRRGDLQILHLTGKKNYEEVKKGYEAALAGEVSLRVDVRDYLDDMFAAYCACDLVVSRAGATTIAELTSVGTPSILVPYPWATGDHQTHNARELERAGAARLVADGEFDAERFDALAGEIFDKPDTLEKMAGRARGLYRPGVAGRMAAALKPFLKSKKEA